MSEPSELAGLFADEPLAPEHFCVLLYGSPGSGKSTAAATLPGPILWVNADRPNALMFPRKKAKQLGTKILEVKLDYGIDPREQLRGVLRYLKTDDGRKVQTVVLDTVGGIRGLLADALVTGTQAKAFQEWGAVADVMKPLVKALRDMPVNAVFLAHQSIEDVEEDRIVRPAIGGSLTEQVMGDMDIVAFCAAVRTETGVRYMGQLVEARGRVAKDSSGLLGTSRELDLGEWLRAFAETDELPWAGPVLDAIVDDYDDEPAVGELASDAS